LQCRAESPRKESKEHRAQQRDGNDVGGRNARLRPDERRSRPRRSPEVICSCRLTVGQALSRG
jgi:hypothetical protein